MAIVTARKKRRDELLTQKGLGHTGVLWPAIARVVS